MNEVMKVLRSGKSPDRYKQMLHILNKEDCEEQPKKRLICFGYLSKDKSVIIRV